MSVMKSFDAVKRVIDKMDYNGLRSMGAPEDEFQEEARMICQRISAEDSAERIAAAMAEVFSRQFSSQEDPKDFYQYAEEIRQILRA